MEPDQVLVPGRVGRFTRRVGQATLHAGAATRAWSGRPGGRFVVPLLVILATLALAGSAGAYWIPAAAPQPPRATSGSTAAGPAAPGYDANGSPLPGGPGPDAGTGGPNPGGAVTASGSAGFPAPAGTAQGTGARPADALAGWAARLSRPLDIPVTALQAYGYAELVLANTRPGCRLRWTTLAGIGKVETNHGRANRAMLQSDGRALPPILGPRLDGHGGTTVVRDTDQGRYDGDTTYDRAIGPMQFIPSTWVRWGTDADLDGVTDPNDVNDAALAAANYLCANGRDLSTANDWWEAILSYNELAVYARDVFDAANGYGTASRTVT